MMMWLVIITSLQEPNGPFEMKHADPKCPQLDGDSGKVRSRHEGPASSQGYSDRESCLDPRYYRFVPTVSCRVYQDIGLKVWVAERGTDGRVGLRGKDRLHVCLLVWFSLQRVQKPCVQGFHSISSFLVSPSPCSLPQSPFVSQHGPTKASQHPKWCVDGRGPAARPSCQSCQVAASSMQAIVHQFFMAVATTRVY
jgi:hypothetical protein